MLFDNFAFHFFSLFHFIMLIRYQIILDHHPLATPAAVRVHTHYSHYQGRPYFSGKDAYSPEVDSSPAPSSNDPQHVVDTRSKQSSRGNSFEIENLLKTAGEVSYTILIDFDCSQNL